MGQVLDYFLIKIIKTEYRYSLLGRPVKWQLEKRQYWDMNTGLDDGPVRRVWSKAT